MAAKGLPETGSWIYGGPIMIAGGVVFIGAYGIRANCCHTPYTSNTMFFSFYTTEIMEGYDDG